MDNITISPKKEKRNPNCKCVICGKPLYRRPHELKRVRHVACMEHRAEAQRREGQTQAQKDALSLGRLPGTNNRTGYRHTQKTKEKISITNKKYWEDHPEQLSERGKKMRGAKHYRWNGGINKLNSSIRRMTENRNWMDAIKNRDKKCVRCGSTDNLESHHIIPLAGLIEKYNIQSRDDARQYTDELWNLDNGEVLCQKCHYDEHGRTYAD